MLENLPIDIVFYLLSFDDRFVLRGDQLRTKLPEHRKQHLVYSVSERLHHWLHWPSNPLYIHKRITPCKDMCIYLNDDFDLEYECCEYDEDGKHAW